MLGELPNHESFDQADKIHRGPYNLEPAAASEATG
nr:MULTISPECIES: hypothetical protein [Rhizobium]